MWFIVYIVASIYRQKTGHNKSPKRGPTVFKWAILANHVTKQSVYRVSKNYSQHENKYNFEGISFPTPLHQVKIFERNNLNVSVNVYRLEKKFQPPKKYPTYEVYPLRVVDQEKANHFDLLLVMYGDNTHYVLYIKLFTTYKTPKNITH